MTSNRPPKVMVYGAGGFSGEAIARRLVVRGHDIVLAGRSAGRVEALAAALGTPARIFDLDDAARTAAALADVTVMMNAAGPFWRTATPMIKACLRAGAHYLDLAGEWPVFAHTQARGPEAAAAGVMLMPGVGWEIVVTDCLLAHAIARVPDAVLMRIGVSMPRHISRGTYRSALSLADRQVIVRRNGVLKSTPTGRLKRTFNFGAGESQCLAISYPDVVTAQHTTGVANTEAYLQTSMGMRLAFESTATAVEIWGEAAVRGAYARFAGAWPEHPTAGAQARATLAAVVETVDPWRRERRFGLRTLDGYAVTTLTATAIVERVLAGDLEPGFQTPAGGYGEDLILGLDCAWPYDAGRFAPEDTGPLPPGASAAERAPGLRDLPGEQHRHADPDVPRPLEQG
jgi:saccharopine dehydrogenase (NAD+, L-lysine-forming)